MAARVRVQDGVVCTLLAVFYTLLLVAILLQPCLTPQHASCTHFAQQPNPQLVQLMLFCHLHLFSGEELLPVHVWWLCGDWSALITRIFVLYKRSGRHCRWANTSSAECERAVGPRLKGGNFRFNRSHREQDFDCVSQWSIGYGNLSLVILCCLGFMSTLHMIVTWFLSLINLCGGTEK